MMSVHTAIKSLSKVLARVPNVRSYREKVTYTEGVFMTIKETTPARRRTFQVDLMDIELTMIKTAIQSLDRAEGRQTSIEIGILAGITAVGL